MYGDSMQPTIRPGSTVRLEVPRRALRTGDCVLVVDESRLVYHRVVRRSITEVTVRGDSQRTPLTFPQHQVIAVGRGTIVGGRWLPYRPPRMLVRCGVAIMRFSISQRRRLATVCKTALRLAVRSL